MTEPLANEEKPVTKRHWAKIGVFFSTLGLIIFVCAFGYGYFELAKINVHLAQTIDEVGKQSTANQADISALQKSLSDLQQAAEKNQSLATQQENLMAEWRAAQKGDLKKWQVAEAEYLVKLANDHLQFTHNQKMALILLQRADQILGNLSDPTLLNIRKSLANTIATLQAGTQVDETDLYLRLSATNTQLDQLPLPATPLKTDDTALSPASADTPWWKAGLNYSWQALRKIVIVRYTGNATLPLVLPEEKVFLYQNLHAQLENAMWGLLNGNAAVYEASLDRAMAWIHQYFVADAPATKATLANLDALRKVNIRPAVANLTEPLQLFNVYFSQTGQSQLTPAT